MSKFKKWVQDNGDLLLIGAGVTCMAAIATATCVYLLKDEDGDGVREVFRSFNGNDHHDFAGLLGMGRDGSLWAHPVNAHSFMIGQSDGVTMQYCEYSPPGLDVTDLDAVEAAMVAEETAQDN